MRRTSWLCLPGLALLLVPLASAVSAQTPGGSTGSIIGTAMVDDKPASDIVFVLSPSYSGTKAAIQEMAQGKTVVRAKTDSSGHYRFEGLAMGRYQIAPLSGSLVLVNSQTPGNGVSVAEGEEVTGIDFVFTKGGAVTGTVIGPDGRPMIGVSVNVIASVPPNGQPSGVISAALSQRSSADTDDRGVFRVFGLASGKYIVSVERSLPGRIGSLGPAVPSETFYPGVTDKSAAGVVELPPGGEIGGIDIKVGPVSRGYEVTGRVIDDSGRGVSDIMVSFSESGMPASSGGPYTDSKGNFKIEHVLPGSYQASASFADRFDSSMYAEVTKFDVAGNVSGIELKVHNGLTIAGSVAIEGTDDPEAAAKLPELQLFGMSDGNITNMLGLSRAQIGQDGSFILKGFPPGKVRVQVLDFLAPRNFRIMRVEQNGVPLSGGIDLSAGQSVSGIRVVLGYANCSVTGQVTFAGGKLPPGAMVYASARPTSVTQIPDQDSAVIDFNNGSSAGAEMIEVDPSGHFHIDGLVPGNYSVVVNAMIPNGENRPNSLDVSQTVTLGSGQEAQVSLVLDVSSPADHKN